MSKNIANTKIALVVIDNKKLLVVRDAKEEVFKTIGGKVENDETDMECLFREVKEELNAELDLDNTCYLFEDISPSFNDKSKFVHIKFYTGKLKGKFMPSSEISEVKFIDSKFESNLLTFRTVKLLKYLKEKELID